MNLEPVRLWQSKHYTDFYRHMWSSIHKARYLIAGNFHGGVLVFVIFMVALAVTKFPSMKINAYTVIIMCTSVQGGWGAWSKLTSTSNNRYCRLGIFVSIYPVLLNFVGISLLGDKEDRDYVSVTSSIYYLPECLTVCKYIMNHLCQCSLATYVLYCQQ